VIQEVARLNRGTLRPETLGLTLAEARSILAQQAAEFIAQQRLCSHCDRERSCKGRHQIVFSHAVWQTELGESAALSLPVRVGKPEKLQPVS
jgi:hypothetical protein